MLDVVGKYLSGRDLQLWPSGEIVYSQPGTPPRPGMMSSDWRRGR